MYKLNSNLVKILKLHQGCSFLFQYMLIKPKNKISKTFIKIVIITNKYAIFYKQEILFLNTLQHRKKSSFKIKKKYFITV